MRRSKILVIGLGAMGSAVAANLAQRGYGVVGFERYGRAHNFGSSHGDTRAIRAAYVREEEYIPLVLESYELWGKLERDTGSDLLRKVGGLVVAPEGGITLSRSVATANRYGIPYDILSPTEVTRRWPTLVPPTGSAAFYEPSQSIMSPEKTVSTNIEAAIKNGAQMYFNTIVSSWSASSHGVAVQTSRGNYEADRLIIAGGAWLNQLVDSPPMRISVERLLQVWVEPEGDIEQFRVGSHPRWVLEDLQGKVAYAFPILEGQNAIKMAFTKGEPSDPDCVERNARPGEIDELVGFMSQLVPAIQRKGASRIAACLSGRAPDDNFIIGFHPASPNVIVSGGFSSHGFKFVPVIGEILADLATKGTTTRNIKLFSPSRFLMPQEPAYSAL